MVLTHRFALAKDFLIVIVCGLVCYVLFGADSITAADLIVAPAQDTAQVGDTVSAKILVSNVADLYGAGCDLAYDFRRMRFVGASEGTFLSSGGSVSTIFAVTHDSARGSVLAGITRSDHASGGVTTIEPADLLVLTFEIIGADSLPLTITRSSLTAPDGVTKYVHDSQDGWIIGVMPTDVIGEPDCDVLPDDFSLNPPYPNPFNASTTISLEVQYRQTVSVEIFDCLGRRTCRLFEGSLAAGSHRFSWNGLDRNGSRAATGVYHVVVRTAWSQSARKILLLK